MVTFKGKPDKQYPYLINSFLLQEIGRKKQRANAN